MVQAILSGETVYRLLVRPQPGVRGPQSAAGLRPSPLRRRRDRGILTHPLLGAPAAGGVPGPHQGSGGPHHRGGRSRAERHRPACRGRGVHPLTRSSNPAGEAAALSGPARTRRHKGGEESVLQDVRLVRGRLSLRGREVEAEQSRGALPDRKLPARLALRRGIAQDQEPIFDRGPPHEGRFKAPRESSRARLGRGVSRKRQDRASAGQKSWRQRASFPTSVTSELLPSIDLWHLVPVRVRCSRLGWAITNALASIVLQAILPGGDRQCHRVGIYVT